MQTAKVVVLSLSDAADRRRSFADRAVDADVEWAFFDAHRALSEGLVYTDDLALMGHGRVLKPGELGCYSSHVAIWARLVAEDDVDRYIVLEDDVIADWAMIRRIAQEPGTLPGYLRLYSKKPSRFEVVARNYLASGYSLLRMLDKTWGTQGYVIDKAAARKLLASTRIVRRPIDDQMDRFWDHGVQNLALFPHPLIEEYRPSTIGLRERPDHRTLRRRVWIWIDRQKRRAHMLRYRLIDHKHETVTARDTR